MVLFCKIPAEIAGNIISAGTVRYFRYWAVRTGIWTGTILGVRVPVMCKNGTYRPLSAGTVEEEMLMRKFYELMSAQSPARKNEEETSTLPDDGRNGQSSALIPACNNEPIGQSSAFLIPVCSDEPIGQSSALTPVSGNEQEIRNNGGSSSTNPI
ncbi:hypothetical protein RHMOL_Rhmol11G0076700 [Rhododendron molle]|uniref:Uncharacterized protein n=1 Tax=Rhododendron molle TaxID=49168 RepID=A0ACC0LPE1_RHOML|nr:hypothetical protein RHMOL_Rhmol11G0076700 [Rhododendron molle]